PNHAGTTRMADRRDPMIAFARLVLAAQSEAAALDMHTRAARATVGKVACTPNAVNAVPAHVTGWLDARAEDEETLDALLEAIAREIATDGISVRVTEESRTPAQYFDVTLSEHVAGLLPGAPLLATGAGHDAGVLAEADVPSAMLFVRNPTGISHSPEEFADDADCETGGAALADVLADLLTADTLPQ
ncbi:MAG: M20/M25/M40 family metallo-hydrolase, partial [Actinomycetota bacterium]